jgi:hypothetical protein
VKNDIYAVYNNSEYRLGARDGDWINLCSNDSNDLNSGFTLYNGVVYIKKVRINELNAIYSVKTYADYKGYRCQVIKEIDDKLLLHFMIGDYKICENLGFVMADRGVYNKWVNIKDIERIYEIKKQYPYKEKSILLTVKSLINI